MLSHEKVWAAIDALAARHALSASGLAKKAGLDSTAFNKSKRQSVDGRPRWPSTESLAKIMAATGSSLDEFMSFITNTANASTLNIEPAKGVPLVGFAQAGAGGYFTDAGFPVGQGWEMVEAPAIVPEGGYALEVQGDSMLPLYRHGDRLIVDPNAAARKGDRVVVKTTGGEVTAKILIRRTTDLVELHSLNPEHPDRTIPIAEVEWIARIVWASQ